MRFYVNWISYETESMFEEKYGKASPYFRKEFSVLNRIKKATVQYTAMGLLKVYINGEPIDKDYLSPGWTDYRKRIPVGVVDVTELIKENNAIGIVAGNGWALGNLGCRGGRCNYFSQIAVALKLEIETIDGEKIEICTDESWKASSGAILYNDLYLGEYVDNNLSLGAYSEFGYNDQNWDSAKVVYGWDKYAYTDKMRAPITTVKHVLEAQEVYRDINGCLVYDFGQNASGVLRTTIKGEKGSKIVIKHGEVLDNDKTIYTKNLRTAEATDTYICSGEEVEVFRPLFTFHGFRYAEISIDGQAEIIDVKFEVMYSDLTETGKFSCSDANVNQLFSNIVWGQRSNFINVPTDCPQRDERLGWLGDAQVFATSAMYNMGTKEFYEKFIHDILDSQFGNGLISGIAPHIPHPSHKVYFEEYMRSSAGWREALVIIAYEHYLMYGDKKILKESISGIKRFIDYLLENSENYLFSFRDQFGDWLNINAETDVGVLATAYFAYVVLLASKICGFLGDSDQSYYAELYKKIKEKFRVEYLEKGFVIKSDTQTAYLVAYSFGLMSKEEIKDNLIRCIKERDYHLSTGFLGVKYVLPVLCEIGATDIAYKMLTDITYPSWCYSVVNGATTIWERWNSFTLEKGIHSGDSSGKTHLVCNMNSFNHYSLGSCAEWMYKYCLGINAIEDGAGFNKVLIRPFVDFSGKVTSAEGSYDSINGKIAAKWKKVGDTVEYQVEIPENIIPFYDFSQYTSVEEVEKGRFILWL